MLPHIIFFELRIFASSDYKRFTFNEDNSIFFMKTGKHYKAYEGKAETYFLIFMSETLGCKNKLLVFPFIILLTISEKWFSTIIASSPNQEKF